MCSCRIVFLTYEIINSVVLFFSYLLFLFCIQSNQRFLAEVLLLRFFKIILPHFGKKNQCPGIWMELFYVFFVVLIIVILLLLLLLLNEFKLPSIFAISSCS